MGKFKVSLALNARLSLWGEIWDLNWEWEASLDSKKVETSLAGNPKNAENTTETARRKSLGNTDWLMTNSSKLI